MDTNELETFSSSILSESSVFESESIDEIVLEGSEDTEIFGDSNKEQIESTSRDTEDWIPYFGFESF